MHYKNIIILCFDKTHILCIYVFLWRILILIHFFWFILDVKISVNIQMIKLQLLKMQANVKC